MKDLKLNSTQIISLRSGEKSITIKPRANCSFLTKHLDAEEYISNVLGGCGVPVHYDVISPWGKKGDEVKIKDEDLVFKIDRVSVDNRCQWVLRLSPVEKL